MFILLIFICLRLYLYATGKKYSLKIKCKWKWVCKKYRIKETMKTQEDYLRIIVSPYQIPSECCIPVDDSLVDPVRGYNIRLVD